MSTNCFRRSSGTARIAAAALAAALFAGCGDDVEETPADSSTYASAPTGTAPNPTDDAPVPQFTDAADEAGIVFTHHNGARGEKYLPETMGSGAAVLDADGDGRPDLYLVNGTHWPWDAPPAGGPPLPRLYLNRGDGTFADGTEAAGLAVPRFGLGATVADYDADGDDDLFVTGIGPNALFRNDGGRFTDVAAEAGVAGAGWVDAAGAEHPAVWTSATFLDYDDDGVLDLYACRYVRWARAIDVFTTIDGKTKAYTIPDRYEGDSGRLWRGRGDGTFEDVTEAAGVRDDHAKALGVVAADVDLDGDTDLVVANDTQPNHLFLNRGDGTFEEVGLRAGIAYDRQGKARADMGIDVGQVDADGPPVIPTGTFAQEAVSLYRRQDGDLFAYVDDGGVAGIAGATFPSLTFGLLLEDFDLDGCLDLALANGHIEPSIQSIIPDIPYAQRPQLFLNRGDGRFREVGDHAGPAFQRPSVGRGLVWLDYDADGDPDLVLTANGGPARLLRNGGVAGRRSLRIRLVGTGGNRDAFGARVAVTTDGRTLSRERKGGGSFASCSEATLIFGLGEAAVADGVIVHWPGPDPESVDLGSLAAGLWRVERGAEPVRLGD